MTSVPTTTVQPEIAHTMTLGEGADQIVFNYHDQGQAQGQAIVLLHGSGPGVTAWANWRTVLPELADRWRVLAPDMAGFGYTVEPRHFTATPAEWIAHLVALLDALQLPAVHVIGNSFGGALALHLAHQHPGRVKKLVLMGSVGISFPMTDGLEKVWGYQPSLAAMRELLGIFAFDAAHINDDLAQLRYQASVRAGVQERFAKLFPAPRQQGIEKLALSPQQLAQIAVPVALVHGREDRVIPFSVSERLAQTLPDAVLYPIEQCGHWVQIEKRDVFLEIVREFFADTPVVQTVAAAQGVTHECR